jgi:hypothetical protein
MAERRMFAKTIIDSDAFMDMPLSAQALYFHLSMRADDDGFINNPKKIQRMIGASDDDFKLLIMKRFVITFESGVVVIKHWKIHNYIRNDRYKPTIYREEKSLLEEKENKVYTEKKEFGIPNGHQRDTQVRLESELESELEVVVVEDDEDGNGNECENVDNYVDNMEYMNGELGRGVVLLTQEQMASLLDKLGLDAFNHYVRKLADFIIEKKASVGNHYGTILKWYEQDKAVKGR